MKAKHLHFERNVFRSEFGRTIVIELDLYEIIDPIEALKFPDGYRFSWIAFDQEEPEHRVLFDCHPPKGPHFHIGPDKVGQSFKWTSLDDAKEFFLKKTHEYFGKFE